MGFHGLRRSIRASLAYVGIAAATASAITVLAAPLASASSEIVLTSGDPIGEYLEGTSVANQVVARFTDSGNVTIARPSLVSACDTAAGARYTATIDWLGNGQAVTAGTVTCSTVIDQFEVHGTFTYKDSGNFNIKVTVTDTLDDGTATGMTDTAAVSDQALSARSAADVTGIEGTKVTVHSDFWDSNPAYSSNEAVDPGLTATIAWGDGTTSAADRIQWADSGDANVTVTGSHVYDANTPATQAYSVKVTLNDDGEQSASKTSKATIADAALTAGAAKSFVAPGAQPSSPVVASFTDAAGSQAAAADFNATINWGDAASSAATVTQTAAGAFNLSGTHTYSSAGTKSLTITVQDQEGKTLSISATATVPALPNTGQPQPIPVQPAMPRLALLALIVGLAIASGAGLVALRRMRI